MRHVPSNMSCRGSWPSGASSSASSRGTYTETGIADEPEIEFEAEAEGEEEESAQQQPMILCAGDVAVLDPDFLARDSGVQGVIAVRVTDGDDIE